MVKASWPAIVSEDSFYEVQDRLDAAKQLERTRLNEAKARLYILSGVFKCGECGSALVGQTYHGERQAYRYYGHTTTGAMHGCKIQRVSADEVEEVVLKYLRQSLVDNGYFKRLVGRISEIAKRTVSSSADEVARVKRELADLEHEAGNVFRIQSQG